jgi:hypothetical protein
MADALTGLVALPGNDKLPQGTTYGLVQHGWKSLLSGHPGASGGGSNTTTNSYGINTSSKTYAGDTYAALTRDQWAQYVSTFVPIENQLIKYATDPNTVTNAMSQASADVNSSFNMQQGATQRHLQGLGVSLTPEQQRAQQKSYGLSRSLADVGAQNMTAEMTRQRQSSILGNPAPIAGQPLGG